MSKIATKIRTASHVIFWEDATIPGFDCSCDVEIRVHFTAIPAERRTQWTPGFLAETEINHIEVESVRLFSECGEPLDVDGRKFVADSDVIVAFLAKHEESDIAERCLESLA